jgi:hypothetical protein
MFVIEEHEEVRGEGDGEKRDLFIYLFNIYYFHIIRTKEKHAERERKRERKLHVFRPGQDRKGKEGVRESHGAKDSSSSSARER